ncbi:MAG TPA: D-alanine--D-alanine ligase [Gammaproteobacteria bacterium]|nr:D-alanine--D-alanine ligase [Gammaproteobacteria bacterium]
MKKIRVGILFGGKSAEHEISLLSAKNVIEALDKDKYEPVLIGIDKTGRWLMNEPSRFLLNSTDPKLIALNKANSESVALAPQSEGRITSLNSGHLNQSVDVVFPILHGPFGEDGTIQGLLKLANVPFVGAGVLGSAVGMDKDVMKRLLHEAGIPIPNFLVFRRGEQLAFEQVTRALGLPLFVKPANLGSSVGISKAKDKAGFDKAVADAFRYDGKILVEEAIQGREIECAVLGNDEPMASVPGEIIPTHEFYDYEAKYIDEHGARLEAPAKLPPETGKHVQDLAIRTFKVLNCEGMGRVDFFLKPDGTLLVNEINTIPGFTKISMYPRLWGLSGVSYTELIDRLIKLAFERHGREQELQTAHTGAP